MELDEFSVVDMKGLNTLGSGSTGKIQVKVGDVLSPEAFVKYNGKMVQALSAYVEVSDGKVEKISWDHGCIDCSSSDCVQDSDGNTNCYHSNVASDP